MVDAGRALADDAQAHADPTVLEVPCDREYTTTTIYRGSVGGPETSRLVTTGFYAEVRNPSITRTSIRGVDVTSCGYEAFSPPADSCPSPHTCTVDSPPLAELGCVVGSYGAALDNGVVRVSCGTRQSYTYTTPAMPPRIYGGRYRTARITIR